MVCRAGHRKISIRLIGLACAFALALLLSGCGAKPVWMRDDPRVVVQGYLIALDSQSPDIAWEFLSSETRQKLGSKADAFNNMEGHGASHEPKDMLRLGHVVSTTREYKKIDLKTSDNDYAVVDIILQDETVIPVTLHREDQRWAIHLPMD